MTREQVLLQIVLAMWIELRKPQSQQDLPALEARIRGQGHAWALPSMAHPHDDELLTTSQVADLTGYAESTIRVWPSRHQLAQYNGRFRWGDVDQLIRNRTEGDRTRV